MKVSFGLYQFWPFHANTGHLQGPFVISVPTHGHRPRVLVYILYMCGCVVIHTFALVLNAGSAATISPRPHTCAHVI